MKTISPFLILLVFFQCFNCCSQQNSFFIDNKIIPIDTITIPHEIMFPSSIYSSEYNTQINCYFIEEKDSIKFFYCVDSIMPTSIFYLKNSIKNYIVINKDKFIVCYQSSKNYLVLNKESRVIDTLINNLKLGENNKVEINSFYYQFPIKNKNGEYSIYTELFELKDEKFDFNYRRKKFSLPSINEIKISENNISLSNSFGVYPEQYRSKKGMYMYQFFTSINKKNEIFMSFYEIDSFYIIKKDESILKFPLKSKFKTKPFSFPDSLNIYDQYNINKIASENYSYTYNFFDSYRDQYYVIVNHPLKYENEDGTINDLTQRPWSIIIINKDFKQVDEIPMPQHLNKHKIFIFSEGIAVLDNSLSSEEKNVFVILKIKKYE